MKNFHTSKTFTFEDFKKLSRLDKLSRLEDLQTDDTVDDGKYSEVVDV